MMPTFALPGDRTPGQLGPIRPTPGVRLRFVYTRSSSCAGMPSVIAMIVGIPASAASSTESAAKRAGTNTIAVLACVSSTASWKVLNTGMPSTLWPPLPGVTPETTFVPYFLLFSAWKVPSRPVMPDTQRRVSLSMRMLTGLRLHLRAGLRELHDALGGVEHRRLDVQALQIGLGQQTAALLVVRAVEAHDERHLRLDLLERLDEALGHLVAPGDAAEDVEQHGLDLRVGQDALDRRDDRVGLRSAAGVEEVRRRAADLGDHVERRHDEPGAVAEDADVAVELDVRQPALLGHLLLRVLGRRVAQRRVLGMAERRVVVERDLRVERAQLALGRDDQGVDLDEHGVLGRERLVELGDHRPRRADEVLGDARVERQAPAVEVLEAEQGVDMQRRDGLRVFLRDRLDVHAALRRQHDERRLRGAVEDDGAVPLVLDLRGLLDPDLVDRQAADVHPEDVARVLAGLVLVLRDLDAAELAAPADLHLRLDDARVADRVGGVERLVDRGGRAPIGHRDSVAGEELLALVFE